MWGEFDENVIQISVNLKRILDEIKWFAFRSINDNEFTRILMTVRFRHLIQPEENQRFPQRPHPSSVTTHPPATDLHIKAFLEYVVNTQREYISTLKM